MKTTYILYATLLVLLASCDVDNPIYLTPHPNRGTITLTTDWSKRSAGIDIPASYTVRVGDYSATLTGTTNAIDNLFAPATYRAYIYNTTANIAVNTTVATADYASGTLGWFFSSAIDAKVEADADQTFTAPMRQQVVEMGFTVTPSGGTTDKIESITGTLGGVAGAMNMDTNTRSAATTINLAFDRQTDGTWLATVRLLGITGNSQPLTTTVKFIDGTPPDVTDTTDINDEIEDNFDDNGAPEEPGSSGGDGKPDINLGTEIVETPTETGFTATINGWQVQGGKGTAD